MDKSPYSITIKNKRIYDYYKSNPSISIEDMNIILLDFIENLSTDMSKLIRDTVTGQILDEVREIKVSLNQVHESIKSQMYETNKSFIQTITLLLSNTNSESNKELLQSIQQYMSSMIDRIHLLIPKLNDESVHKIEGHLQLLGRSVSDELTKYVHKPDIPIQDFIVNLESKLTTLQQPLYSYMTSNYETINSKLGTLKDDFTTHKLVNDKVSSDLNEFLTKYKHSSQFKGSCSEKQIEQILVRLFPSEKIVNTTAMTECGDFMIERQSKTRILIENKNYDANVDIAESEKFIRDCIKQKSSGIMMSQNSGIVCKPNFFIEINNGCVLVYLHHVDYSYDKIKMAIDVIDNLYDKLQLIQKTEDTTYTVSKESLERINFQYSEFMKNKELILNTLKENHKKTVSQIELLDLPDLSLFLNEHFASVHNQQYLCDICNKAFPDKKSLAGHKKVHKEKEKEPEMIQCKHCTELFPTDKGLHGHMKRMHKPVK